MRTLGEWMRRIADIDRRESELHVPREPPNRLGVKIQYADIEVGSDSFHAIRFDIPVRSRGTRRGREATYSWRGYRVG